MNITHVDNNFRWGNCPLCHSSSVRKIDRADYEGKVNFSSREINLSNHPEIWICDQCSSGFVQNIIPEATAVTLYSMSHAGERWSRVPFDQLKTPEVVRTMSLVLRDKGRVLDVGCNTGELLDFAGGFGCVTSGLEYSDDSCEVIRSKGHKPYQSFDKVLDQFEVITAFDLIEHLYDVPTFLNNCHSKLVNGGKLILLTGDIQSVSARAAGAHWWYAQYPEHIVFPSRFFFESLPNFRLENWVPTYASAAYNYPFYRVLLSLIKRIVIMKKYNGLPSCSPDHALIVLTKVDA
jgi:SAM-dependent methyltransferase